MGHYNVKKKIRRRKVANLASISKRYSVNNCTIVKANTSTIVETKDGKRAKSFTIPKEGFPQPKRLHHSFKRIVRGKLVKQKSQYPQYKKSSGLSRTELIEGYIKEKLKKWEIKNPCPAKDDDLFKEEFIPKWKAEKEEATKRISSIVHSKYDNNIKLYGKYEGGKGYDKELAKINDKYGEVTKETNINKLDPKKSHVVKKAKKITNAEKKRNPKLIAANLKDLKSGKGRIILPEAA